MYRWPTQCQALCEVLRVDFSALVHLQSSSTRACKCPHPINKKAQRAQAVYNHGVHFLNDALNPGSVCKKKGRALIFIIDKPLCARHFNFIISRHCQERGKKWINGLSEWISGLFASQYIMVLVLKPSLSVSKVHNLFPVCHVVLTLGQLLDHSESVSLSGYNDIVDHSTICIQVFCKL